MFSSFVVARSSTLVPSVHLERGKRASRMVLMRHAILLHLKFGRSPARDPDGRPVTGSTMSRDPQRSPDNARKFLRKSAEQPVAARTDRPTRERAEDCL